MLDVFEESLEALRVAYDKYFTGVDKVAPVRLHEKVQRQLRNLEALRPRSTALRFRLAGLRARFVTYGHYWTRVLNQMERGVSRRDLRRSARAAREARVLEAQAEAKAEATRLRDEAEARAREQEQDQAQARESPSQEPRKPPPHRPARSPASKPIVDPISVGLDPGHVRDVFRALVKAKRDAGESTQGLTYAALCRKLSREVPKLRERHRCDKVEFEVVAGQGKVRLRALPRM